MVKPLCGCSSVGRALACQARGHGFESRYPLHFFGCGVLTSSSYPSKRAGVAQLVEHLLPKQGVSGSNPVTRSKFSFYLVYIYIVAVRGATCNLNSWLDSVQWCNDVYRIFLPSECWSGVKTPELHGDQFHLIKV